MIGHMGLQLSVCAEQTSFPAHCDRSGLRRAGHRQHVDLPSRSAHEFRDAAILRRPDQPAVIPAADKTPSIEIDHQA